jgi:hypothetical protein
MFLVSLGLLLHAPRGPFYSPKAARSRWRPTRKAILAFYRVAHRAVRCRSPSFSGADDRCTSGPNGALNTVRCTPDSPVLPSDRWCRPHVARGLRGRPLAHWTVRCTNEQSGAPPDSPVNFSRTPLILFPRATTSPQTTH